MAADREVTGLIEEIMTEVRLTSDLLGKDHLDPHVIDAIRSVPRHEFVPESQRERAYWDCALPIGRHQTISQPFIVAVMTDAIAPEPTHNVLEIGTGCGYQAAVLSRLVRHVYSVEIDPILATEARDRLRTLGYDNVTVTLGDGHRGWREHAPYDGILVTAAPPRIPHDLVEQLRIGGKMVIPIGPRANQVLVGIERTSADDAKVRALLPVAFVPMIAEEAPS